MSVLALRERVRPSDGLAIALVIGMFAVGALAYEAVPAEMLVHYTPPGGVYYGPETLPKAVGLFVIPVVSVVVFGVLRGLPVVDELDRVLAPVRPYYQAAIVLTVASLGLGQVALIVVNVIVA